MTGFLCGGHHLQQQPIYFVHQPPTRSQDLLNPFQILSQRSTSKQSFLFSSFAHVSSLSSALNPAWAEPPARVGHSLVPMGASLLALGGFDSTAKGTMLDIRLPSDWCSFLTQTACLMVSGCSWCPEIPSCVSGAASSNCSVPEPQDSRKCGRLPCDQRASCSSCLDQLLGETACDWCQ